jgi:ketosteroid isomerase-like protein
MEHPSATLVRQFYAARMEKGTDNLRKVINEIFANNVVWHYPGNNSLAGDYNGKEGVIAFFKKLTEMTNGNFRLELVDLLANDNCVIALEAPQAERKGKNFHWNSVLVYRLDSGKVCEVHVFQNQQHHLDDFWS